MANCRAWLESETLPSCVQDMTIILLLKGDIPHTMNDWCMISLSNVPYRLVAKVLANRMRDVMPKVVSEEQSPFVYGRSIVDNILIAFETLQGMKLRYKGKAY